jgi:RNA polymerase sigma-70 factor (ECF subfamily)
MERVNDAELLDRARRGDLEAFGMLVDRHGRAVHRAALALLGSAQEAEDVAQEAFVTAFQKLETFRGEAAFRTWLVRIAWRQAQDRRRSLRRRLRRFVSPLDVDAVPVRAPGRQAAQEEELAGAELREHVRRLLRALPATLREPLLLAATGEHTYQDMAVILDTPVGTLKWRVSEARRLLKERLRRLGYRDA